MWSILCELPMSKADFLLPGSGKPKDRIHITDKYVQQCCVQVSQNGLDIVGQMIDRLGSDFRPYLMTVLSSIIDRLGTNHINPGVYIIKIIDIFAPPLFKYHIVSPHYSKKIHFSPFFPPLTPYIPFFS